MKEGLNDKTRNQRFRSGTLGIQRFMDRKHFLKCIYLFYTSLIYSRTSMICLGSMFLLYFSQVLYLTRPVPHWAVVAVTRTRISADMASVHTQLLLKPFLALLTCTEPSLVKTLQQLTILLNFHSHFAYYFGGSLTASSTQHWVLSIA